MNLLISDNIQQLNDIGSSTEILQNFDLPLDLLLLHRLQNLDHALLIVHNVDSLKHLAVLSTAKLFHNFVVILLSVHNNEEESENIQKRKLAQECQ